MKTRHSLVKKHALTVSKTLRADKFKRVGIDFVDAVEADLDAYLRRLYAEIKTDDTRLLPEGTLFTGEAVDMMKAILQAKAAALIQNRVKQHPSMGVTLKA